MKLSIPALATALVFAPCTVSAALAQDRPNILIIWGDDIGYWNISAYNQGMMGYRTPNIDRIAREGALFTDAYGEQSCTQVQSIPLVTSVLYPVQVHLPMKLFTKQQFWVWVKLLQWELGETLFTVFLTWM